MCIWLLTIIYIDRYTQGWIGWMDRMDNRNVLRSLLTTADPDAISLSNRKPRTLFVHARVQRPELAQRDVARREGAFAGVGGDHVDGVPVGAGGVCG